jgi:nucleotide-binding universal stress UspA family protein
MFKRILVPLDGSRLAEQALPYAEGLVEKFGSQLTLVQAIPPPPVLAIGELGVLPHDFGPVLAEEERLASAYLLSVQKRLREKNIASKIAVLKGRSVADAIVDAAQQESSDLIVKTTHGRSGFSRWVYGSVATKVLEQAPCPVLLIRIRVEEMKG